MANYLIGADRGLSRTPSDIKMIQQRLENLGHNVVNVGVSPTVVQNALHNKKYKDYIVLFLLNGAGDGGTFFDFYDGHNRYYFYKRAYLLLNYELNTHNSHSLEWWQKEYRFSYHSGGSSASVNYKRSSWEGLTHPEWNSKYGDVVYVNFVANWDELISVITGAVSGAGLSGDGSSTGGGVKRGYDKGNPFNAYIAVGYTINDESVYREVFIDFSRQAPTTSYKNRFYAIENRSDVGDYNNDNCSFNNEVGVWLNNKKKINTFNLLKMFQIANNDLEGENKYYLRRMYFRTFFAPVEGSRTETTTTTDEDGNEVTETTNKNVLYDSAKDQATYKMNLYGVGFFNGDASNPTTFDSFGESINTTLSNALKDTTYITCMDYKEHRNEDVIVFKNIGDKSAYKSKCTFVEDPYNNAKYTDTSTYIPITGISNVKYTPLNNKISNYIVTYDEIYDSYKDLTYKCARDYYDLQELLRIGDKAETESLKNTYSRNEVDYIAKSKYNATNRDNTTCTIQCEGLPPCDIGDIVTTEMFDYELCNLYNVSSMTISVKKDTRPIVQTKLGLGEIDKNVKVDEFLQTQRNNIQRNRIDVGSAQYRPAETKLWEDNLW